MKFFYQKGSSRPEVIDSKGQVAPRVSRKVGVSQNELAELQQRALTFPSFEERGAAVLRLGASTTPRAARTLIAVALRDTDISVRRVALWSLSSLVTDDRILPLARLRARGSLARLGAAVCAHRSAPFGEEYCSAFIDLCRQLKGWANPALPALRALALCSSNDLSKQALEVLTTLCPRTGHRYFLRRHRREYGVVPDRNVLTAFTHPKAKREVLATLKQWIERPKPYAGGYHNVPRQDVLDRAEKALYLLKDLELPEARELLLGALGHHNCIVAQRAVELVSHLVRAGRLPMETLRGFADQTFSSWRPGGSPAYEGAVSALAATGQKEAVPDCLRALEHADRINLGLILVASGLLVKCQQDLSRDQLERLFRAAAVEGHEGRHVMLESLAKCASGVRAPWIAQIVGAALSHEDLIGQQSYAGLELLRLLPSWVALGAVRTAMGMRGAIPTNRRGIEAGESPSSDRSLEQLRSLEKRYSQLAARELRGMR